MIPSSELTDIQKEGKYISFMDLHRFCIALHPLKYYSEEITQATFIPKKIVKPRQKLNHIISVYSNGHSIIMASYKIRPNLKQSHQTDFKLYHRRLGFISAPQTYPARMVECPENATKGGEAHALDK